MPDDDAPLKSAYELAMERLREQGAAEPQPLTDEQKQEIAQLRSEARAKLAEMEIMHEKERAEAGPEPEKLQELEEHYRIDRKRVESGLESKVTRIKRGSS